MTKKNYLETLKSAQGRSISHYCLPPQENFLKIISLKIIYSHVIILNILLFLGVRFGRSLNLEGFFATLLLIVCSQANGLYNCL